MPRFILKAAPDEDLYLEWSTIVDDATWIGNRAEALTQFQPLRIKRADTYGTSELGRTFGSWNDDSIIVQQQGILRRSHLADYARALQADDDERAIALLEPFDDDDDDNDDEPEAAQ